MSSKIITLITDFGQNDSYVGSLKGVILSINPSVTLVDISHEVTPYNVIEAGFLLGRTSGYFPPGTIHLTVVDPGVGSSRKPLALVTPSKMFIGPDNGIFSQILSEQKNYGNFPINDQGLNQRPCFVSGGGVRAYHLSNPDFWLQPVSRTFHARDIFAPVAAYLSLGINPNLMGEEIQSLENLELPVIGRSESRITGSVIIVDRFGNLITNIEPSLLGAQKFVIVIKDYVISGLSESYSQGTPLLAIIGSHGFIEIAVKEGNASGYLGVGVGEGVLVEFM